MLVAREEEQQRKRMAGIMAAACKAFECTEEEIKTAKKCLMWNTRRGVIVLVANIERVKSEIIAEAIGRTRSNCVNITRKYYDYRKAGDRLVLDAIGKLEQHLEKSWDW